MLVERSRKEKSDGPSGCLRAGCLSVSHSLGISGGGFKSKPWAKAALLHLGRTLEPLGTFRKVDAQAEPKFMTSDSLQE